MIVEKFDMRKNLVVTLLLAGALASCATAQGRGRAAMSHEEMVRHCQMMEQDVAQGGHNSSHHGAGRHGGTSHEEMARHCAEMGASNQGQQFGDTPGQSLAASSQRLEQVAAIGAQVMPFDLDRTTHTFSDRPWGGVQTVASDDGDLEQLSLIRSHLADEASRFSRGEFGSPERIHGHDMPGLSVLRERYADIEVSYAEAPTGAAITYRSEDRALIDAVHAWFQAQRSDHGAHARH